MNAKRVTGRSRRAALLAAVTAVVAACAGVADLDVDEAPRAIEDGDESGVREDGPGGGEAKPDGGGADAEPDVLPIFAACGCPMEQGCCVNKGNATPTCVAPADAGACTSSDGIFLRCVAGDLFDGRACCLAKDARTSFFATECSDAGARLCASDDECDKGAGLSCQSATCRNALVRFCTSSEAGGLVPPCPL